MTLLIQCIVVCVVFTLLILPPLLKNPVSCIISYPKAIRERVETLPEYKTTLSNIKKRHLIKKVVFTLLMGVLMAVVAWFSGANTFIKAFLHVFILFFSVNMYDLIVLDIGFFCHSKRVRIHGTEDMINEYQNPKHHIKGAVIGTLISFTIAIFSASLVGVFGLINI